MSTEGTNRQGDDSTGPVAFATGAFDGAIGKVVPLKVEGREIGTAEFLGFDPETGTATFDLTPSLRFFMGAAEMGQMSEGTD